MPRPRPLLLAMLGGLSACSGSVRHGPDVTHSPYIGVNVNGVTDYGYERLFADAMKSARPFGPYHNAVGENGAVDADGWPTGDASLVVMADLPGMEGSYRLSYDGSQGTVTPSAGASIGNPTFSGGRTHADLTIAPGTTALFLDFSGFPAGAKRVKLMRPGHTDSDLFNRDTLARFAHFSTLRTLDYAMVNYTQEAAWADRTRPGHATQQWKGGDAGYQRAASWEHFVELCNTVGADAWINVPDQASDDYVTKLAQLLLYGSDGQTPYTSPRPDPVYPPLDPRLRVNLEYSNELWNFASGFDQSRRNLAAAVAEVGAGDPDHLGYDGSSDGVTLAMRRVAARAKHLGDLFRAVFGAAAMGTRVRPVLAGQTASSWTYATGLRYLEHVHGPPRDFLFGVAGTTYFYLDNQDRAGLTLDQIFAGLDLASTRANLQVMSSWARMYGLEPVCYEGTHHMFSAVNGDVMVQANMDPRMKDALVQMYRDWFEVGGTLHNFSAMIGQWSGGGQWGLSQDPASEATPKWDAIKEVIASPLPAPTVGLPLPATLGPSDAAVTGDGSTSGSDRTLQGADPDVAYLVRATAAGSYRLATAVSGIGVVQVQVDGIPVASWSAGASSATVRLEAGLHAVRVVLASGASATVQPIAVSRI